jgi:hypothetical protein
MRLAPEGFVEGKERPGGSQAVAGHLQLCHRVNILHLGKQFSFNPTQNKSVYTGSDSIPYQYTKTESEA